MLKQPIQRGVILIGQQKLSKPLDLGQPFLLFESIGDQFIQVTHQLAAWMRIACAMHSVVLPFRGVAARSKETRNTKKKRPRQQLLKE
jgi:hypothetical protein